MATKYSEIPDNFDELSPFLIQDFSEYAPIIDSAKFVVFYDTCAIQHHSSLQKKYQKAIGDYLNSNGAVVVITTCVLMELAGEEHLLHSQTIHYLKTLWQCGIKIVLFDEACVFDFLIEAYQTAARVNQIFRYALRQFCRPATTIKETVYSKREFIDLLGDGEVPSKAGLFASFIKSVRANKQHEDNLAEQLIGICVYMLLHLVAEPSYKFNVYTDDKAAASQIYQSIKTIPVDVTNNRAGIYSSAKLFQFMYKEHKLKSIDELKEVLQKLYPKNIRVLGLREKSDLETSEFKLTSEELAGMIDSGEIRVVF